MIFQNLWNLVWLVPLATVIIALYMLKMRRKEFRVPATFLWPEQTEEVRANALIQKLKFNWLLLLQLLVLGALLLAFARPQFKQTGLVGETTVIVLDASASMNATDVSPSRLGEAKRIALEAIKSAKPGDRLSLIEAGPTPRVIFSLSSDPVRQAQALNGITPSDAESDIGESLRLAAALVNGIEGARILLLSDGCFDKVTDFSAGKAVVVYNPIGTQSENMAITALGTSKTGLGNQLFCAVRNYGTQRNIGTLNLYADDKILNSFAVDIAAGETWSRTITAPAAAQVITAKLDAKDLLQSDNFAATVVDPNSKLSVLLVSKGNPFLERALLLDPRVTLDKSASLPNAELSTSQSKYDIIIFDGITEQPVKSRGVLSFAAHGPGSRVTYQGTMPPYTFAPSDDLATPSKLVKGVDLIGTYIDKGDKLTPSSGSKVDLASSKGPLIVSTEGPHRQIYVGFNVLQSDFPLQVSFPIFIANALDFLSAENGSTALVVKPGVPFSIQTQSALKLVGEDKQLRDLPSSPGVTIVRDVRQAGRYTLQDGKSSRTLLSVLRSDTESKITPNKEVQLGAGTVRAAQAPTRFSDFWRPILLLALLILCIEWVVFARKS